MPHSRFSDNPFRDPNLTPEQVERIEERNAALRLYRETGDMRPAVALGLFPPDDDTTHEKRFNPEPVSCDCGRLIRPGAIRVRYGPEGGLNIESDGEARVLGRQD